MKISNRRAALLGGGFVLMLLIAFGVGYIVRDMSQFKTSGTAVQNEDKTSITDVKPTPLFDDPQMMSMMQGMDHGSMVTNDGDFIMGMIPHHEEAIETSTYMLTRTEDPEFKEFLQNIIDAQNREVAMMKEWHEEWFAEPYRDDGRYIPMMPDLEAIEDDESARQQYLMGMIMHHMGAVQMATKIKTITNRQELIQFADDIIDAQNSEIVQMREWMMESEEKGGGSMNHMMH